MLSVVSTPVSEGRSEEKGAEEATRGELGSNDPGQREPVARPLPVFWIRAAKGFEHFDSENGG